MATKTQLLDLPPEIILLIAKRLPSIKDLGALVRASRYCYNLLCGELFRRDEAERESLGMMRAVILNRTEPLQRAMALGLDLARQDRFFLNLAAGQRARDTFYFLLDVPGMEIDSFRPFQYTAMTKTIGHGDAVATRELLRRGASFARVMQCSWQDVSGLTPEHKKAWDVLAKQLAADDRETPEEAPLFRLLLAAGNERNFDKFSTLVRHLHCLDDPIALAMAERQENKKEPELEDIVKRMAQLGLKGEDKLTPPEYSFLMDALGIPPPRV